MQAGQRLRLSSWGGKARKQPEQSLSVTSAPLIESNQSPEELRMSPDDRIIDWQLLAPCDQSSDRGGSELLHADRLGGIVRPGVDRLGLKRGT
jgi:hypothetical protein